MAAPVVTRLRSATVEPVVPVVLVRPWTGSRAATATGLRVRSVALAVTAAPVVSVVPRRATVVLVATPVRAATVVPAARARMQQWPTPRAVTAGTPVLVDRAVSAARAVRRWPVSAAPAVLRATAVTLERPVLVVRA